MVLDWREFVLLWKICGIFGVCFEDFEIFDNFFVIYVLEDILSEGEDWVIMVMKWGRGLIGCWLELGV